MDRQNRVAAEGLRIHVVDSERRLRDLLRALQTYPGHIIVLSEPHLFCLYHPTMWKHHQSKRDQRTQEQHKGVMCECIKND